MIVITCTLVVYASQVTWTGRAGPAAQHTGHALADLLAVTVIITATQGLTDAIVTDLINKTGLVIKANILAELSIADLSLWALSIR